MVNESIVNGRVLCYLFTCSMVWNEYNLNCMRCYVLHLEPSSQFTSQSADHYQIRVVRMTSCTFFLSFLFIIIIIIVLSQMF